MLAEFNSHLVRILVLSVQSVLYTTEEEEEKTQWKTNWLRMDTIWGNYGKWKRENEDKTPLWQN